MSAWYALGATGALAAAAAWKQGRLDLGPSVLALGSLGGLLVSDAASKVGSLAKADPKTRDPLVSVMVDLVALYRLLQTLHWQSSGDTSYQDHLLFQRLYEDVRGEVDSVAERLVGLFDETAVDPEMIETRILRRLAVWQKIPQFPVRALMAERDVLETLRSAALVFHEDPGTENMLQGFSDKHMEHAYLLQQRTKRAPRRQE